MKVTEHRCDRCGHVFGPHEPHITFTINYHHPRTLDICRSCEGLFVFWLGKHPGGETSLETILAGRASGNGYPSKDQIEAYKAEHG